jgi:NTE family protein
VDVGKLERERRVGVAYSGGGQRVVLEIGIAQALIEAGITPDVIAGVSAGGFAGVFHALDPHSTRYLDLVVKTAQRAIPLLQPSRLGIAFRLLPSLLWGLLFGASAIHVQGINSNTRIRRLLERRLPVKTFHDLHVPLSIGATAFQDGSEVWFDRPEMELIPALLASSAVPGVFPPVSLGDKLYIDGSVANNLPLFHLAQQGCQLIYACNVGYAGESSKPPNNLLDTVQQSISITQYVSDVLEQQVMGALYPQVKIIPIRPKVALTTLPSAIRPEDVPALVAQAAAETRRILAEAGQPAARGTLPA